jgi:hypothetical protein
MAYWEDVFRYAYFGRCGLSNQMSPNKQPIYHSGTLSTSLTGWDNFTSVTEAIVHGEYPNESDLQMFNHHI